MPPDGGRKEEALLSLGKICSPGDGASVVVVVPAPASVEEVVPAVVVVSAVVIVVEPVARLQSEKAR